MQKKFSMELRALESAKDEAVQVCNKNDLDIVSPSKLFGQDSLQNDSFVLLIDAPAGG